MTAKNGPITTYTNAKEYLENFKIPQMFESLVAALIVEKPEDHFTFMDSTLTKIKGKNNDVHWETFVSHLHPHRNPERLKILGIADISTVPNSIEHEEPISQYQPGLFKLTET